MFPRLWYRISLLSFLFVSVSFFAHRDCRVCHRGFDLLDVGNRNLLSVVRYVDYHFVVANGNGRVAFQNCYRAKVVLSGPLETGLGRLLYFGLSGRIHHDGQEGHEGCVECRNL